MNHFETNGETDMPWPWEYCKFCMDLRHGTFLNWPFKSEDFEQNLFLLDGMYTTWNAMKFCQRTMTAGYKWTVADINYDTWIQDGREEPEPPLSEYEHWLLKEQANDE